MRSAKSGIMDRVVLCPRRMFSGWARAETVFGCVTSASMEPCWVGGNRSKERDRKSELVLRSTYQTFEWDRNNSDRNFYNVVRYVHIPLVP